MRVRIPVRETEGNPSGTVGGRNLRRTSDAEDRRREKAMERLRSCRLCPRSCGVDRTAGELGFCGADGEATVAAVSLHDGEEPPISGTRGSGAVFFSRCNMSCLFCQNYPISQMGVGNRMTPEELGDRLLSLEERGAHNVNFVTPTPHVPQMIGALREARKKGFSLPVVYNTNGYDSMEALALLDGVVDIYLPDMKYRTGEMAALASGTPGYPEHNARAVAEMLRQVGPLAVGEDGIARRGVLIRHLVLPGRIAETRRVLSFVRREYGKDIPLSLMGQYFPANRAGDAPPFSRKLRRSEYDRAVDAALRLGLENVTIQEI